MERKLSQAIVSSDLSKVKKYYNVKLKEASYVIACSNPDVFRFLIKKGFPIVNAYYWYEYAYKYNNRKILEVIHKHIEPRTLKIVPRNVIPFEIKEFPTFTITRANSHHVKYELYHNTITLADPLARAIVLDRADIVEFLLEHESRSGAPLSGGSLHKASSSRDDTYIRLAMCYASPKIIFALSSSSDVLCHAAKYERIDVFKYGKDVVKPGPECMTIALYKEDLKLVEYLYKIVPFDVEHFELGKLYDFVMSKADYDTVTSYYIKKRNVELVKSRKRYTFNHINIAIDVNCIEIVQHIITRINNGKFTKENGKRAIEKHSNTVVEHFITNPSPEYIDAAMESANVDILEKWSEKYCYTSEHLFAALETGNSATFKCIAKHIYVNESMCLSMFIASIDQDAKWLNVLRGIYAIPEQAILYAIKNRCEDALKVLIVDAPLKKEYFEGSEAVEDELCRQIRNAHADKKWIRMKNLLELSQCEKVLALTKEFAPAQHCYYYFICTPQPKERMQVNLPETVYIDVGKRPTPTPRERTVYAQIRKAKSADDLL